MADKREKYVTGDIGAAVYGISGEPEEGPTGETGGKVGQEHPAAASKGGEAGGKRPQPAGEPATTRYRLDTNQGDMSTGGAGGTKDPGTGTGDTIADVGRDGVDTGVSKR